jgi:hypothetical protein
VIDFVLGHVVHHGTGLRFPGAKERRIYLPDLQEILSYPRFLVNRARGRGRGEARAKRAAGEGAPRCAKKAWPRGNPPLTFVGACYIVKKEAFLNKSFLSAGARRGAGEKEIR